MLVAVLIVGLGWAAQSFTTHVLSIEELADLAPGLVEEVLPAKVAAEGHQHHLAIVGVRHRAIAEHLPA